MIGQEQQQDQKKINTKSKTNVTNVETTNSGIQQGANQEDQVTIGKGTTVLYTLIIFHYMHKSIYLMCTKSQTQFC